MDTILPVLLFVVIAAAVSVGLIIVFDVELLFLYPWAVASRSPAGIDAAVADGMLSSRGLAFAGGLIFILLVVVGFAYDWRKGVFRWR